MILLIILTCFILYKVGAVGWFLNRCRLEPEPVPATVYTPEPVPEINEREKLEKQAHYILTMQHYEYPETTAYMSDTMLLQIINNYCKN